MKLTYVEQIPKRKDHHDLQGLLREFINSDRDIAKVEFTDKDYKSPVICASCLSSAIKRSGYRIRVMRRGKDVYLFRDNIAAL